MKAAPRGQRRQRKPEAASPATARSAGRSLLSRPAQRPIPAVDLGTLTLWILFRAMVGGGGGGGGPRAGGGGGVGKGRGGLRPPRRSRVGRRRWGVRERGSGKTG